MPHDDAAPEELGPEAAKAAVARTTRALLESRIHGLSEPAIPADVLEPLYAELRAHAHRALAGRRMTLDTVGLANEAYLRLVDQSQVDWQDRARFLAAAAVAVRRALVDHWRKRRAEKRGGARSSITLGEDAAATAGPNIDLIALDEALEQLAREHPRSARVTEMRFFSGMESKEIALVLDVTDRTVRTDLALGRAWLRRFLARGEAE